jgi:hypothetical protein
VERQFAPLTISKSSPFCPPYFVTERLRCGVDDTNCKSGLQLALINFLVHAVSTPGVTHSPSQWQVVPRVKNLERATMRSTDQSPALDVNQDSGDG